MNAPGEKIIDKYTVETITAIHSWTDKLFSLRTTRYRGFRFTAGQFARLGVIDADGEIVWRAYSMVSAPYDEHLEFFSITVPGGRFTERLATLRVGDELFVDKTSFGFLTIDRFSGEGETGCDLWMLASGTGLAPFVSILRDPDTWLRFERLIVVHSVREAAELAYRDRIAALPGDPLIEDLAGKTAGERLIYLPVVTRETSPGGLDARIPFLVADGRLEKAATTTLDREHSRIMVCGNPEMVTDIRHCLSQRGFRVSRRQQPGQMAFENYW